MVQWANVDWDGKLQQNLDETLVSAKIVALENGFHAEEGGFSRFPGHRTFCGLAGAERTYLTKWRQNLIAVTDKGRTYRIDKNGNATDVTGVVLSGGRRPIFDRTEFELVMAAGGPILRLKDSRTEILSRDAPQTTHVAFVDGYLVAIEPGSGRWYHCSPGEYENWNPQDVFTAEGKPDDLTACVVTPYRELLLAGEDSVEQFERSVGGENRAFYRRWTTGEGIQAPYTLLAFKTGTFGVNPLGEFVRFQSQVTRAESDDIYLSLQEVTDWTDAWSTVLHIVGQKFILLQIPNTPNDYGTLGRTYLLDYRARRWSELFGWDSARGLPARYPAWSYQSLWGRHFIGVEGGVAELTPETYTLSSGAPQRWLIRSGVIDKWGTQSRIDDVELKFKRGLSPQTPEREAEIRFRAICDGGRRVTRWIRRGLGRPGQKEIAVRLGGLGFATTWQFEIECTSDVPVEFRSQRVFVEEMRR